MHGNAWPDNQTRNQALRHWLHYYNTTDLTTASEANHQPPDCSQPTGHVQLDGMVTDTLIARDERKDTMMIRESSARLCACGCRGRIVADRLGWVVSVAVVTVRADPFEQAVYRLAEVVC